MKGWFFLIGWLFAAVISLLNGFAQLVFRIFNIHEKPIVLRLQNKSPNVKTNILNNIDEIKVPESFAIGEKFENFIRKEIFTKDRFTIVERTHNYQINENDYVESTLKPDFKFRDSINNNEFYIEAKFRTNLFNDGVKWSNYKQLERYKDFSKSLPCFIVIGFGGKPDKPNRVFMFKLNMKTKDTFFPSEFDKYDLDVQFDKHFPFERN